MLGPHAARFKVIGYTDKMQEFMKISDLFIGKPGGMTTAEALACSLPMIIVDPIPGQEERNSDHLLEKGIALKSNELTTLAWKIDQLLDEPGHLETMKRNAGEMGRPNAARTIVDTLLGDHLPPMELDEDQREAIAQAATGEVA
jgi:processive 1,2-diacylglycerol beta-glucosyltransferase